MLISGFGKFCVKEKKERKGQESGHWGGGDPAGQAGGDVQVLWQIAGKGERGMTMSIFLDTETTGTEPDDKLCQIAFK